MEILLIISVIVVILSLAGDKIGSKALPFVIIMCLVWGLIIIIGATSDSIFVR